MREMLAPPLRLSVLAWETAGFTTDGRFSGGSRHGCRSRAAPEAAVDSAIVSCSRRRIIITIDADGRWLLHLHVSTKS